MVVRLFHWYPRKLSLSAPTLGLRLTNSRLMNFLHTDYSQGNSLRQQSQFTAENLFREILLSYRMLFGSDAASRRRFKHIYAKEVPEAARGDPLLEQLCGQRCTSNFSQVIYDEVDADPPSETTYLTSDYPIFGQRLYRLHKHVEEQSPTSLRLLW